MKKLILFSVSLLVLASCTTMSTRQAAVAALAPTTASSTATGTVELTELRDGRVNVTVRLSGVPEGVHGFHIHERGDCGDAGNNAGGHFAPEGNPHGAPGDPPHHAGDFGNVTADAQGNVRAEFMSNAITLGTGERSVIGRAVILHASPDDLTTQPTGNAGARIACGVIRTQP